MTTLTDKDIRKIAHLARLEIAAEDIPTHVENLSNILNFVEQINDINTDNIMPMVHKSKIDSLIVGETGVITSQDPGIGHSEVSAEGEAEFYEILFTTLADKVNGFFTAFQYGDYGYRGDPAEAVVKKWYQKL